MLRQDGRRFDELRPIIMNLDVMPYAEGSVCIEVGQTKVFCAATIEERVPSFLRGKGKGWVTAEYSMLPRATEVRNMRESIRGKLSGRTMEIQRLIGRSLRSVVDLEALGERSVTVDCDVLHADGGTRTTSITGAFVAMVLAMQKLVDSGKIMRLPVRDFLASVSVGIHQNGAILDLNYEEDSSALVDMNVVKTGSGRYVEVQGTGEEATYSDEELMTMLKLSGQGIHTLVGLQRDILGSAVTHIGQSEPTNGEVR